MPTRDELIHAAEQVIREHGIAGATTRAIARAAGCSEGSLYNHFRGKEDLIRSVVTSRMSGYVDYARDLPERAGTSTVEEHLVQLGRLAIPFFRRLAPMFAAALSDPESARDRAARTGHDHGPRQAIGRIVEYLRREQQAGRVSPAATPEGAAAALVGACMHYALVTEALGPHAMPLSADDHVTSTVRSLLHGLAPHEEQ